MKRTRLALLLVLGMLAALLPMTAVPAGADPGTAVFFNEIHYDNVSTDAGEAIEVAGPAGTDLTGWSIVLYNGNNGAVYDTDPIPGTIPDQQNGFGTVFVGYPSNGIQNGSPDGLALVDASSAVVQFLCYEGTFTAVGGPADGMTCTDIGVSESGSGPIGDSLQLSGTGTVYEDFTWVGSQASTFGNINTGQTFGVVTGSPLVIDCGSTLITDQGVASSATITAIDADDAIVDVRLVSDTVTPAGSLTEGTETLPGGAGVTASLELNLDTLADAGAFTAAIEAENATGDIESCTLNIQVVVITLIHDIQGSGLVSPMVGATVVIEGIVVGDFQDGASGTNGDLNGFFVQEEDADADGDPATSEGIFVFNGNSPAVNVANGDLVRVSGAVSEFFEMTQITSFTGVTALSSGNALPTAAIGALPVGSVDDFERFEGMYVTFPQALVISEYFNFDRFGEIVLTADRSLSPTAEFEPGSPEAAEAAQDYLLGRITLDDGRTNQNPDPALHPNGGVFNLTNLFRGGDTVENVTGVMNYAFDLYRIQPTQGADYTKANPRTASPDPVGGTLKVATFNVLNYFATLDDSGEICGPLGDQGCRGADNADEFTRQRDKIITAITAIDADVVGLMEIENDAADVAVVDLVSGLNDAAGAGTYAYVATGPVGPDAIRVALIYQPASVARHGSYAVLEGEFLDPNNLGEAKNRAALAQSFVDKATGAIFTVAVNHLKSKGSGCGAGDDDPDAGSCNLTRTLAAGLLADWLQTDPTDSGDADVLIIGDLNSYDKEDPIDVLQEKGFNDLVFWDLGEGAYSYVFDGQIGYLDYIMANDAMAPQVTGTTVWHINADEPDLIDYDTSFKQAAQDAIYAPDAYRSSDHDPVVIGLELTPAKALKETTSLELSSLLPTGNKNDDKSIQKAIDRINESLNPAWWIDNSTLDPKDGGKVFDREHQAVQELMKVKTVGVQAAIDSILSADRQLAFKELLEAVDAGGNAGRIQSAMDRMADAAASIADGDYAKAVLDYKKAWQEAVKA